MTAKDNLLFQKDKNKLFENSQTDSGDRYSDLNLNQNLKCLNLSPIQSNSKSNNDKINDSAVSESYEGKEKRQTLKKSSMMDLCSKYSNFITITDEVRKDRKKYDSLNEIKNNSTLSLHISAYENSNKAAVTDSHEDKNNDGLKKSIKKLENTICSASTFVFQNPFEFARQQNYNVPEPELSQFRASQRLYNPNSDRNEPVQLSFKQFFCSPAPLQLPPPGQQPHIPPPSASTYFNNETWRPTPFSSSSSNYEHYQPSYPPPNHDQSYPSCYTNYGGPPYVQQPNDDWRNVNEHFQNGEQFYKEDYHVTRERLILQSVKNLNATYTGMKDFSMCLNKDPLLEPTLSPKRHSSNDHNRSSTSSVRDPSNEFRFSSRQNVYDSRNAHPRPLTRAHDSRNTIPHDSSNVSQMPASSSLNGYPYYVTDPSTQYSSSERPDVCGSRNVHNQRPPDSGNAPQRPLTRAPDSRNAMLHDSSNVSQRPPANGHDSNNVSQRPTGSALIGRPYYLTDPSNQYSSSEYPSVSGSRNAYQRPPTGVLDSRNVSQIPTDSRNFPRPPTSGHDSSYVSQRSEGLIGHPYHITDPSNQYSSFEDPNVSGSRNAPRRPLSYF